MWKRRFNRDSKDRQIGHPVLIQTTYDEKRLNHTPTVGEVYRSGTVPSGVVGSLHPHDAGYLNTEGNRLSMAPTVSSIYSQPSPGFDNNWGHQSTASSHYSAADVSPPISPPISPIQERSRESLTSSRDVSPVDENPDSSAFAASSAKQPSQIPLPRKAPVNNLDHSPQNRRVPPPDPSHPEARWDEYTGERTTSGAGKTGQVKPGLAFSLRSRSQVKRQDLAARGNSAQGEAEPARRLTLAERAARFGQQALSIETKQRPEWKGASGRAPMIQPVKDKPAKQPFSVRKMVGSLSPVMSVDSGPSPPLSATANRTEAVDVSVDKNQAYKDEDSEIKPTVPLKAGLNSPTSATRPVGFPYPSPEPPVEPQEAPTNNVPKRTTSLQHGSSAQQIDRSTPPRKSTETSDNALTVKEDDNVGSRFSWTTYATNTTYQHSPPPSPPPPMPSLPAGHSPLSVPRRRPLPSSATNSMASSIRKPVPRPTSPTSTVRTFLSTSTTKALPRPPPEVESVDLISNLQAQLGDLEIRRSNVRRLIRDLNKVETSSPLVTDLATRRESARKAKEFEEELAEITNLEHDIGLRLHRAYKRRERDAAEEPTTLWVRRVTG